MGASSDIAWGVCPRCRTPPLDDARTHVQKDDQELPPVPPRGAWAVLLLLAALAAIGWLTLKPMPASPALPLGCIICGSLGGVDFALNILLFVPLGVGAFFLLGRPRRAILLGALTTIVVEALQWRTVPGRDASFGDLLANTIGAALGVWLVLRVPVWLHSTGARARSHARVSGISAAAGLLISSFAIRPAPTPNPQWILWTANRPHLDSFPAVLAGVVVNGQAVRGGNVLRPHLLFAEPERTTDVTATVNDHGGPTRRLAHIVAAANPLQEGFFMGQRGDALVFRTYVDGSRLRLRPVMARLDGAFEAAGSSPIVLSAHSDRRTIVLSRTRDGEVRTATLRRTLGLAWTLFLPWYIAIDASWWVANAAFLALLVVPAAFFASRGGTRSLPDERRDWTGWWPVALVIATLALAPVVAGIALPGAGEWSGVLAGIAAGTVAGRLTRARTP